jgi:hypothetical protein
LAPFAVAAVFPEAHGGELTNFAFSALGVSLVFLPLDVVPQSIHPRLPVGKSHLPLFLVFALLGHNNFFVPESLNLLNPRLDNLGRSLVQLKEIAVSSPTEQFGAEGRMAALLAALGPLAGSNEQPVPHLQPSDSSATVRWVFDGAPHESLNLGFRNSPDDLNLSPIVLYAVSGIPLSGGFAGVNTGDYGLAAYENRALATCRPVGKVIWSNGAVSLSEVATSSLRTKQEGCW